MAAADSGIEDFDHVILSIDPGSSGLKVSVQAVPAGERPEDVQSENVNLLGLDHPHAESVMVYDHNDELIVGLHQVNDYIQNHPNEAHRVIEYLKHVFFDNYQDSTTVKRVYTALDCDFGELARVQEVYKDVFEFCKFKAQQHLGGYSRRKLPNRRGDTSWAVVPMKLRVPIPVNWSGIGRGVLRNAARDAEFEDIQFLPEPICLAADYVAKNWNKLNVRMAETCSSGPLLTL
jgi:hypothetical protein